MSEGIPQVRIEISPSTANGESEASRVYVDELRDKMAAATQRALGFLGEKGVVSKLGGKELVLKGLPDFRLLGSNSGLHARANIQVTHKDTATGLSRMSRRVYERTFGLQTSGKAAKQERNRILRLLSTKGAELQKDHPEELDENDIFFYFGDGGLDAMTPTYLASLMTHELWHLLENREGVLRSTEDLIHEGTATHVQRAFLRQDGMDLYFQRAPEIVQVLYGSMSNIVAEELGVDGDPDDLTRLLTADFRNRLIARFDAELAPDYFRLVADSSREFEKKKLQAPEYRDFVREPTKENLLLALRRQGLSRHAKAFKSQDMTRYLQYMQRLLA